MAGMLLSIGNIGVLIASLYPTFIVSFLVVASLFNLKILTGLIYLLGIIITFGFCLLLAQEPRDKTAPVTCDFFSSFGYNYKSPSFGTAVTWFTLIYLLIPMVLNPSIGNPVIIIVMLIGTIFNMIFSYIQKCSNLKGLVLGLTIGLIIGTLWYSIISATNKSLLFYNELISNNVVCNKPAKQTFKCHVYKNGEIISSTLV